MKLSESEIEELIYNALLCEDAFAQMYCRGLDIWDKKMPTKVIRQLNLYQYGIPDIITISKVNGQIHVYILELKAVEIQCKDFNQIGRYMTAATEVLRNNLCRRENFLIEGFLIGSGVANGHYIDNVSHVNVITYEYGINGFEFFRHTSQWSDSGGTLKYKNLSI